MDLESDLLGEAIMLFPVLFILPFLFLILIAKCTSPPKRPGLPPGPYPWPLIGNIFLMSKKPHVSLTNLARTHGQLISLRLGQQLLVVGSSPAAAAEILKTHDRTLSGRYVPAVASKIPQIVRSSLAMSKECNDTWKSLRSICHTEIFSAKAVESQAKFREKKMMEMVGYLGTKEGEIVKLSEIVFPAITNCLSNILVSRDLITFEGGVESERMKGYIRRLVELVANPSLADLYPILDGVDVWSRQKAKDIDETNKLVWGAIIKARRERENGSISAQDFLDALIEKSFRDDKISVLLMELLTAGTDTSCSTIEWTMAELIKNEEAMYKLRDELAKATDGDVLRESNLSRLPYLQACVKETMRLHPPGPFLVPHRALQTCKVMNYTIPKDCLVLVNIWAIGRDPLTWNDSLSFKPERFLDSDLDFRGTNFEFIPFSAGRRICPGLPVAVKQVQLLVAFLVHYFDWFLPHGMDPSDLDMNEKFGMSLQMEKPLHLIPRARKQQKC